MFSVSTPALLEYKATLPSNKRGSIAAESRQQFLEVYQNKALILHDTIEALERCVRLEHSMPCSSTVRQAARVQS